MIRTIAVTFLVVCSSPVLAASVPSPYNSAAVADWFAAKPGVLHRQMKQHSPAAALRRAQLMLIQTDACRHPYYWAPFIVVGRNDPIGH